jgi:hypothetical protein
MGFGERARRDMRKGTMTRITVEHTRESSYRVTVEEQNGRTVHDVTVSTADVERYAPGTPPERLLQASFEFLLEREPKESILRSFELGAIERYFPDYPGTIAAGTGD